MTTLVMQSANPIIPNPWEVTVLGIGVLALLLIVVVLVDIARAHHLSGLARAVWVLIALAFPLVGPILWFLIGRRDNPRNRATGHTATTN